MNEQNLRDICKQIQVVKVEQPCNNINGQSEGVATLMLRDSEGSAKIE